MLLWTSAEIHEPVYETIIVPDDWLKVILWSLVYYLLYICTCSNYIYNCALQLYVLLDNVQVVFTKASLWQITWCHRARQPPAWPRSVVPVPTADQYIPGTILDKITVPCSYTIEAQGKWYCRTREHIRPIHLRIPVNVPPNQWQTKPHTPQAQTPVASQSQNPT